MNRGITVLQTAALATWLCRPEIMERANGFEPSTSTLARWHSTTELRPLGSRTAVNITDKKGLSIKNYPLAETKVIRINRPTCYF